MFEEGGQARKSSKGIPSCISEGFGRRRYKPEFIKFLIYAQASCDETSCHLNLIKDTHKPEDEELKSLICSYEELGGKINRFIEYVEKHWKTGNQTMKHGGVQP